MVQPVVADRGVGRPDLADQALGRDVQVAEGRRDVADLVAPGVAHVEGQVTAATASAPPRRPRRAAGRSNAAARGRGRLPSTAPRATGPGCARPPARAARRSRDAVVARSPAALLFSCRRPPIRVPEASSHAPRRGVRDRGPRAGDDLVAHVLYRPPGRGEQHRIEVRDQPRRSVLAEGAELRASPASPSGSPRPSGSRPSQPWPSCRVIRRARRPRPRARAGRPRSPARSPGRRRPPGRRSAAAGPRPVPRRVDQVVHDHAVGHGDIGDRERPAGDLNPQGRQPLAGRGELAGHVHGPVPAHGAALALAQRVVHPALRGVQAGLRPRTGPQAQRRGCGALHRQLVSDPGRREGQLSSRSGNPAAGWRRASRPGQ